MKSHLLLFILIVFSVGCKTVSYQEKFDRIDPKGSSVNAPFDRMIANGEQPEKWIGTIYFHYDDAVLSAPSKEQIQNMVTQINQRQGALILEGHASYENSETYNKKLGYERALVVAHYLHDAGVWQERMTIKSFSHTRPASSNHIENERKANRRVEIKMLAQGDSISGTKAQQLHQELVNAPQEQEPAPMMGIMQMLGGGAGN